MIICMMLFVIQSTDMFGGQRDRPVVFKAGGTYNYIFDEIYWKSVFKDNDGGDFKFEPSVGGFLRVDIVLARFKAPKTPKYAWGFMEFTRRAHEFLFPKGLFNGYNFELYTIKGSTEMGTIHSQVIPIGISVGLFTGETPWFPYHSIGGGAGFVTEKWELNKNIGDAELTGSTSSTAWYGKVTLGLIRELRNEFGLDISISGEYLTFSHSHGQGIPGDPDYEKEDIQKITATIGLVFALPMITEKTIW